MSKVSTKGSVKVNIKVNGLSFYVNPNALTAKVGSKGTTQPVGEVYRGLSKGEARKLRKTLRSQGFAGLAGVPRSTKLLVFA